MVRSRTVLPNANAQISYSSYTPPWNRYYGNPTISLPDDQSGNFRNTELAHFLLTSPTQSTNKYELLYNQLYSYNIPGHPENIANWKASPLTDLLSSSIH